MTHLPVDARDIDALAALIREVDGNHDKGAAALAEALLSRGVRTPLTIPPRPPREWCALDGDECLSDTLSATPEAAASVYWGDELWASFPYDGERPATVEVCEVTTPSHARFARGLSIRVCDWVTDAIAEAGGEWAESAIKTLESNQLELSNALEPLVTDWLYRTAPDLGFFERTGTPPVTFPAPADESEQP